MGLIPRGEETGEERATAAGGRGGMRERGGKGGEEKENGL